MRIAIIGSRGYPYVYSGYETFVKEFSERLVQKNVSVTVYCHKNLFTNYPENINGVDLVYIPTIETKSLSQLIHSFFSMLHACVHTTDIILVVNAANGPLGILSKIFRKKTLINVDGMEWLRPKWKGLGAAYFKIAAYWATKLYDIIITDSEVMQQVYRDTFNKESTMIAYGANLQYSTNSSILNQFNLIPNDYYLIVGRLIPDNNADSIVAGYLQSNSNKKLVVVGDVPYKDTYADNLKMKAGKKMIFTGYIKDDVVLSELYLNCFAYIHGHEFGGTNPTLLKAMACGCGIFALDTAFNREMLSNGVYGYFFKKEAKSISALIVECEAFPEKISLLKYQSRKGITAKYNWENITTNYFLLMQDLLLKKK